MKIINKFLQSLCLIYIVFFLIKTQNCLAILGMSYRPQMSDSNWTDSDFHESLRFSIDFEDSTCSSRYDMGYQRNSHLGPDNFEAMLNPHISLRHGFKDWTFFKTICSSYWSGARSYSVKPGKVTCANSGAFDARKICVTILNAPSNRSDLYRRLLEIQRDAYPSIMKKMDSSSKQHVQQVLDGNVNAINSGMCSFKGVEMPWWKKHGQNKINKYISQYSGQKMICAFDVTGFIWISAEKDRCQNPNECAKNWDDLIKCALLPMGPPPHPFAPFIVHEEPMRAIYNSSSTYNQPKINVLLFDKQKSESVVFVMDNLNEGDNLKTVQLNSSNYQFKVNVSERKICVFFDQLSNNFSSGATELGCFPRIGEKNINLQLQANQLVINGFDIGLNNKGLKPIGVKDLYDKIMNNNNSDDYFKLAKPEQDIYISSFRSGFAFNPENKVNNFLPKKVCVYNVSNASQKVEITINELDYICETNSSLIKPMPIIFRCSDGKLTDDQTICPSSVQVSGFECRNGNLVEIGQSCSDISSYVDYEDDYAGEKICARNFLNHFKSDRMFFALKNNSTHYDQRYLLKFVENSKLLISLNPSIAEDGSILPNQDKKFNDFSQEQLKYLTNLNDNLYNLDWQNSNTQYEYDSQVFKNTIFTDENGEPFAVKANEKYYDAPPSIGTNTCIKDNNTLPVKEWEYILQVPGYYANYDFVSEFAKEKFIDQTKLSFKKIPGIFVANEYNSIVSDQKKIIQFSDQQKQKIILTPTKWKDVLNPDPNAQQAKIGIADEEHESRIIDAAKLNISSGKSLENFNFQSDLQKSEMIYTDGKNLVPGKEQFFSTDGCNLIEFELYSGGAVSKSAHLIAENIDITKNGANFCNMAHSGQNGGYVKGRFRVRPKSQIVFKISNQTNQDNVQDSSEIWVKDLIEQKPKLLLKVEAGNIKHYCDDVSNPGKCSGLVFDEHWQQLVDANTAKFAIQLDDGNYFKNLFDFKDQVRSYYSSKDANYINFDQQIAIDVFRNPNFTGHCGKTSNIIQTMNLSFPVLNNQYDKYGIVKQIQLPNLNQDGTGNFNQLGSYLYYYFATKNLIDWSKRQDYDKNYEKICLPLLQACYNKANSAGSTAVIDENLKQIYSYIDSKGNSVEDLNLYCPGMGGCYFSDKQKAISHSGTAGLARISCKRVSFVDSNYD